MVSTTNSNKNFGREHTLLKGVSELEYIHAIYSQEGNMLKMRQNVYNLREEKGKLILSVTSPYLTKSRTFERLSHLIVRPYFASNGPSSVRRFSPSFKLESIIQREETIEIVLSQTENCTPESFYKEVIFHLDDPPVKPREKRIGYPVRQKTARKFPKPRIPWMDDDI